MPDDFEGFSDRQRDLLLALVDERHVAAAARKTGIARSTIYSWMQDDEFRRAVGKVRSQVFSEALDLLNSAASKSIARLVELMDAGAAGIRLKAAKAVAELAMQMRASHETEARVAELEARAEKILAERGGRASRFGGPAEVLTISKDEGDKE